MTIPQLPADKAGHLIAGLACFCVFGLFPLNSYADEWTGPDKVKHAAVGAVIGAAITVASKDPLQGCVAATAVGAAKEIYDYQHPQKHTASFKDFAVTAAAGCALAYSTHWVMTQSGIRYTFKF